MAPNLLHLIPIVGRLLRAQHVRRRRRRELSPMSRGAGEGGTGAASREACQGVGEEAEKYRKEKAEKENGQAIADSRVYEVSKGYVIACSFSFFSFSVFFDV